MRSSDIQCEQKIILCFIMAAHFVQQQKSRRPSPPPYPNINNNNQDKQKSQSFYIRVNGKLLLSGKHNNTQISVLAQYRRTKDTGKESLFVTGDGHNVYIKHQLGCKYECKYNEIQGYHYANGYIQEYSHQSWNECIDCGNRDMLKQCLFCKQYLCIFCIKYAGKFCFKCTEIKVIAIH